MLNVLREEAFGCWLKRCRLRGVYAFKRIDFCRVCKLMSFTQFTQL